MTAPIVVEQHQFRCDQCPRKVTVESRHGVVEARSRLRQLGWRDESDGRRGGRTTRCPKHQANPNRPHH